MEGLTRDRVVAYAKLVKGAEIQLNRWQGYICVNVKNGLMMFSRKGNFASRGQVRTLRQVMMALETFICC